MKFHQIILRKFLFLFFILFFIVGAIVYFWSKEFYISQTKDSLLNSIEIISFNLQEHPDFDALAVDMKKYLKLRLTMVSFDGTVLAESHKNKSKMDNHKNRDEILQANKELYGYKIRYSNTIDRELLYIAKKYNYNGEVIYIRLSKELQSINDEIIALGFKIFVVLAIFFSVIFTITFKISKQMELETQNIVNFLTSLTKKTKLTYISSSYSQEFSNITNLLTKISQIIVKKEKQKSKYTNKLQVSNQQKEDIISAISHEFKNPIAVINGYSQTLLDDADINVAIRNKFLLKIHNNGIKLSDLIDRLRLSIKLDGGQQNTDFTHLKVYDVVEDAVDTMKINYPKRNLIIKGDKELKIKADPSLFSVVVSNLIENAIKYSDDEVVIKLDKKSLSVVDTGIGISKKNLENITNKFYRVHENSWNNSLGLGLFIVSNIIKLHNFKLDIKSVEQEGSTFSIKF